MNSSQSFIRVVGLYVIVIIGVLFSSTNIAEKTLYDRFIVNLEGISLQVENPQDSLRLLHEVLDFVPFETAHKKTAVLGVTLPDQRKILLEPLMAGDSSHSPAIIIRVRNGFKKLHKKLLKRVESKPEASFRISAIIEGVFGSQFLVEDNSGTRLLFTQRKL